MAFETTAMARAHTTLVMASSTAIIDLSTLGPSEISHVAMTLFALATLASSVGVSARAPLMVGGVCGLVPVGSPTSHSGEPPHTPLAMGGFGASIGGPIKASGAPPHGPFSSTSGWRFGRVAKFATT
ncbi:hypothetical protein SUGI_0451070 [Cryptomeria japonica]|nr:hypothetical protein SUGI_0451070 [Cryptomeria japonica]